MTVYKWARAFDRFRLQAGGDNEDYLSGAKLGSRLVVEGVNKEFGGVAALRKLYLTVEPGAKLAVVGANGCGKTTLVNVICGYERPDEGKVVLDGRDVTAATPAAIARHGVARGFQMPRVFGRLTTDENLIVARSCGRRPNEGRLRWAESWKSDSEINRILGLIRLVHVRSELAKNLSYGQQKLLEIGGLLLTAPTLLLLDEPASGVDLTGRSVFQQVLGDISGLGVTIVVIEHDMDFVAEFADCVSVMADGAIVASGTPDEIIAGYADIAVHVGA
jgi:ABC-type branched-subunit amino acid transport system ATPase component